jgi:hypothetical protein
MESATVVDHRLSLDRQRLVDDHHQGQDGA